MASEEAARGKCQQTGQQQEDRFHVIYYQFKKWIENLTLSY